MKRRRQKLVRRERSSKKIVRGDENKEHKVPELEGGEEVDGEAVTAGQCLAVLEKDE